MSGMFQVFLENLALYGLEYYRKFYGIYRASVDNNKDPEKRGRIKILCPSVGHRIAPNIWVDPAFFNAGDAHGLFWPPVVGDSVRVAFERGDPGRPVIYWGGWFGEDEVPDGLGYLGGDAPDSRGMVTPIAKHALKFIEQDKEEAVELLWKEGAASIVIDKEGSIRISAKNGTLIDLNAKDSKITITEAGGAEVMMDSKDVNIKSNVNVTVESKTKISIKAPMVEVGEGADSPAMRGSDWVIWAAAHIHPTTAPGAPTGPPAVPPTSTILSSAVMVK